MIDFIRGQIAECSPTAVVVETSGGVGYMISIALTTYSQIKDQTQTLLYVHEAIREDAYQLYGFTDRGEREFFRMLISVSGIGANTARMILSAHPAAELQRAIADSDINLLKGIKGIGLKTAQRIVVELKDKLGKMDLADNLLPQADNTVHDEALSALVMLGFAKAAAQKAVNKIMADNASAKVEEVIKLALKML